MPKATMFRFPWALLHLAAGVFVSLYAAENLAQSLCPKLFYP